TGDSEMEVLSIGMEGLARVTRGDIADGMRLLDESTTAALAGECRDLSVVGTACCYLISACERVRDFERASQWCDRVRDFCRRWRFRAMFTTCRLQYATTLMFRGAFDEAESELEAAGSELEAVRPAAGPAVWVRLGELRRRQ